MNTDVTKITGMPVAKGFVFYDARCLTCRTGRRWVGRLFEARGFRWVPIQTPGAAAWLGVDESEFARRLHVRVAEGRIYHNADAFAVLCRSVAWLRPLGVVLGWPGFRVVGRWIYDVVARNRHGGVRGAWKGEEGGGVCGR